MKRRYRAFASATSLLMMCLVGGAMPPAAAKAVEAIAAGDRIELGRLATGAQVSFVRVSSEQWGIEIADGAAPRILELRPARLEVFRTEDDIRQLAAGYGAVEKSGDRMDARAEIAYDGEVVFQIEDRWSLSGEVLAVRRTVRVAGSAPDGGFNSALMLSTAPGSDSTDVGYFAPSTLYRAPGSDGQEGGTRQISFREDSLAATMVGLSFGNGASITMLNPSPRGDTTYEDIGNRVTSVLLDDRITFGAFGAFPREDGSLEFGYWYPGSMPAPTQAAAPLAADSARGRRIGRMLRRYHRIRDGYADEYEVRFRFGRDEPFPELMKNAWRWAWRVLNPPVHYLDVELVRRTLTDHLADRVTTVEGRTGIPWIFQATTGLNWNRPDDMRCAMGFVGKNIEAADQLLREADRDPSARGQRMRALGLAIIDSFIRLVPMTPPAGEAFDLLTGEPTVSFPPSSWRGNLDAGKRLFLRAPSEDMRMLMEAYVREKNQGRDHTEWLRWCQQFADWLLPQQRADGSFPRAWRPGTNTVVEPSGSSSYCPVPLFVILSKETGPAGKRYLDSAIRAAEYVWTSYGDRGYFTGGTMDNPNVVDKEAGMLALEAFLALFEATQDRAWLARAEVAADYTETYIWIWNVPMAVDASDGALAWKRGVSTVGLQGIAARPGGGVDNYMDWSAPAYAKLYRYTRDVHYLDVARVLLHDTKSMLALPGRTYDLAGPGWQQEHWNIGNSRGFGGHRGWLPWVSTNHLYSITGLEDFDRELFEELCARP
jgi:hypothetical protein